MKSLEAVEILPRAAYTNGPDAIRGSGHAFIYTKYPDPEGKHWFLYPGYMGHESLTNTPEMLQALFGPRWKEVYNDVVELRDEYVKTPKGYEPSGKKVEQYDYQIIRRMAKRENLFGRSGTLRNQPVLMIWNPCENWQQMTIKAFELLNMPPQTIVTVGDREQFQVKDGQSEDPTVTQDDDRLELMMKYHTANGFEKARIAKQLGMINPFSPSKGPGAYRAAASKNPNSFYAYRYAENLDFRQFMEITEGFSNNEPYNR